jgi:hypothetical protein
MSIPPTTSPQPIRPAAPIQIPFCPLVPLASSCLDQLTFLTRSLIASTPPDHGYDPGSGPKYEPLATLSRVQATPSHPR